MRNHPRSEFKELKEQLESQNHEDEHPRLNSESLHPQFQQAFLQQFQTLVDKKLATTQDLQILNCGLAGNIVQASLGWLLALYPNIDVYIDCDIYRNGECVAVTVTIDDVVQADVDVCVTSGVLSFYKFCLID